MKLKLLVAGTVTSLAIFVAGTDVKAALTSRDSSYGPDTLTLDSDTGLLWLDVTLSTGYSYNEILVGLQPGGLFSGFRLATITEVETFWEHAGVTVSDWIPENYAPIRSLMELVGITGPGMGNLGGGRWYDYTAGHTAYTDEGWNTMANLGAYDADHIGKATFGSVLVDNTNPPHGSWLVTPALNLMATVDIDPDTLQLKSNGQWVTAYIELPDGYRVQDIDLDSVSLEGLLNVQQSEIQGSVLMVKFDRADFKTYLVEVLGVTPPADVNLTVTGTLKDGTEFTGGDTIRVIDRGK